MNNNCSLLVIPPYIKWRSILFFHDLFCRFLRTPTISSCEPPQAIHVVYYTSPTDWHKCRLAIQSLKNFSNSHNVVVHIRFDNRHKVSSEILDEAINLAGNANRIGSHRRYGGYGVQSIFRQLRDFYRISKTVNPRDWLAKADSDTIVIHPSLIKRMLNSSADSCGMLIRRNNITFYTGSFYAFRAELAGKIWRTNLHQTINEASVLRGVPWMSCGEDVAISHLITKYTSNIDDWSMGGGLPLLDVTSNDVKIDNAILLHFPGGSTFWDKYLHLAFPPDDTSQPSTESR